MRRPAESTSDDGTIRPCAAPVTSLRACMDRATDVVKVADLGLGPRVEATLTLVANALEAQGWKVEWIRIPARGLPRRVGRADKKTAAAFTASPDALIESWRIARHLDALTDPGDTVLLPDREGVAGIFALEQAMRPVDARRSVLVTAADGRALEYLSIAGTYKGVPESVEFAIDWELVAYRFATSVVATSPRAVEYLAAEGISSQLASEPAPVPEPAARPLPSRIWLPEPVTRLSQTATMLRLLNMAQDEIGDLEIFVSDEDRPDGIWRGTTWDAIGATRALLGETLHRTGGSPEPDLIMLGDPFAVPDQIGRAHV